MNTQVNLTESQYQHLLEALDEERSKFMNLLYFSVGGSILLLIPGIMVVTGRGGGFYVSIAGVLWLLCVVMAVVLLIHNVAIVYAAILCIGFFSAGGALQTGLGVVQMFNPGPKGRNTGIYYTFMGAASYLIPVVAAKLTVISGEGAAVYTLMGMMLVLAILATLSTLYLIAQHKKVFGESPL